MHWIALQPTLDTSATSAADTSGTALADAPLVDAPSAWAWWALQFTPLVARVEAALVLEVSGSERLFGGRAALLDQLLKPNWPLALVEYAQGATSLVAYGRLQCASRTTDAAAALAPDALPLHTLVAARAHLPTLARLGLANWGQLRALPRGGLVRRFGAGLVDALDCAYGQRAELYPWLTLPEVFDAPLELLSSVETATALLFGARRLLAQLQLWLRARQRGVLALELLWELDARRSNALHVDAHHTGGGQGHLVLRTAQATQDMAHLARLLAEQLAQVTLPAPVLHLRLRSVQTQPLAGESVSLLPDDVRHGDSIQQLLERLSARLGREQVRCTTLLADHRPERMQCWQAAVDMPSSMHSKDFKNAIKSGAAKAYFTRASAQFFSHDMPQEALYPTWLLAIPLRLNVHHGQPQHHGPLTLLVGPQRLEGGWLEGDPALRDYYVARSATAGLVWVYCERLGAQGTAGQGAACWYLHGLFA
jgi:protein ImuB